MKTNYIRNNAARIARRARALLTGSASRASASPRLRVKPLRSLLAAAAALAALPAAAVTTTWTGSGTDTNWGTAANWSAGVPNAAGDTANINLATASGLNGKTVTLGADRTLGVLNLTGNNSASVQTLTLGSAANKFIFAGTGTPTIELNGNLNATVASAIDATAAGLAVANRSAWGNTLTLSGAITATGKNVSFDTDISADKIVLTGALTAGSITKTGAGALVVNTAAAIAGNIDFDSGSIVIGVNNAFGSAATLRVFNTGTGNTLSLDTASASLNNKLKLEADLFVNRLSSGTTPITLTFAGTDSTAIGTDRKIDIANLTGLTFGTSHSLTGGTLTKIGTGTLTLNSAASTFTALTATAGAVVANITADTTLGGASGVLGKATAISLDGTNTSLTVKGSAANTVTFGSTTTIVVSGGATFTVDTAVANLSAGTVNLANAGRMNFTGDVTLGATTISNTSGTAVIYAEKNINFALSSTGIVASGVKLDISGSGAQTLTGTGGTTAVVYSGDIVKSGTGTATVSGLTSFAATKGITVNGGTLNFGTTSVLSVAPSTINGGSLSLGKAAQFTGSVNFAASQTDGAVLLNNFSQTFTGVGIGAGAQAVFDIGGASGTATTLTLDSITYADAAGSLRIKGYFGTGTADKVTTSTALTATQLANTWFYGYNKGATQASGEIKPSAGFLNARFDNKNDTTSLAGNWSWWVPTNWQGDDNFSIPNSPGATAYFHDADVGGRTNSSISLGGKTVTIGNLSVDGSTYTHSGSTFAIGGSPGDGVVIYDNVGSPSTITTRDIWFQHNSDMQLANDLTIDTDYFLVQGKLIGNKTITKKGEGAFYVWTTPKTEFAGKLILEAGALTSNIRNNAGWFGTGTLALRGGMFNSYYPDSTLEFPNAFTLEGDVILRDLKFSYTGTSALTKPNVTLNINPSAIQGVKSVSFQSGVDFTGTGGLTKTGSGSMEMLGDNSNFSGGLMISGTGKFYTALGASGLRIGATEAGKNYLGSGNITVLNSIMASLEIDTQGKPTLIQGASAGSPVTITTSNLASINWTGGGVVTLGKYTSIISNIINGGTLSFSGDVIFDGAVWGNGTDRTNSPYFAVDTSSNPTGNATIRATAGNGTVTNLGLIHKFGGGVATIDSSITSFSSGTNLALWGGVLKTTANNQLSGGTIYLYGGALDASGVVPGQIVSLYAPIGGSFILGSGGQLSFSSAVTNTTANWGLSSVLVLQNSDGVWKSDGTGSFVRFNSNDFADANGATRLANIAFTGYEAGAQIVSGAGSKWYLLPAATAVATDEWSGGAGAGNTNWGTAGNWLDGTVPNGATASASIRDIDAGLATKTINMNAAYTVNHLNVESSASAVTLGGTGALTLTGTGTLGTSTFAKIKHAGSSVLSIKNPVTLVADTELATTIVPATVGGTVAGYVDWSGTVSGSKQLIKTGDGLLRMSGNNAASWTGGATLRDNGTVQIARDNTFGSGRLTFGGAATDTIILESWFGDGTTSEKPDYTTDAATRILSSPWTLTGNLTLRRETATGAGTETGNITNLKFTGAGTLDGAGTQHVIRTWGNTTAIYPGSVGYTSWQSLTLDGKISGPGGLYLAEQISGSGAVVLNGANDFAGGVTLSFSQVYAGNDSAFGTGLVELKGGTSNILTAWDPVAKANITAAGSKRSVTNQFKFGTGGSQSFAGNWALNHVGTSQLVGTGNVTMGVVTGSTVTFGPQHILAGTSGITTSSAGSAYGVLRFLGANTFSGGYINNGGTVEIGIDSVVSGGVVTSGALGTGVVQASGGNSAGTFTPYAVGGVTARRLSNEINLITNARGLFVSRRAADGNTATTLVFDTPQISLAASGNYPIALSGGVTLSLESKLVDTAASGISVTGSGGQNTLELKNAANEISGGIVAGSSSTVKAVTAGAAVTVGTATGGTPFGKGTLTTSAASGKFELAAATNSTVTVTGTDRVNLYSGGTFQVTGTNVTTNLTNLTLNTNTPASRGLFTSAGTINVTGGTTQLGVNMATPKLNIATGGTLKVTDGTNLFAGVENLTLSGGKLDTGNFAQSFVLANVTADSTIALSGTGMTTTSPLIFKIADLALDAGKKLTVTGWEGNGTIDGMGSVRFATDMSVGTIVRGVSLTTTTSAVIVKQNQSGMLVLTPFDMDYLWKQTIAAGATGTWDGSTNNWSKDAGNTFAGTGNTPNLQDASAMFDTDLANVNLSGSTIDVQAAGVTIGYLTVKGNAKEDFTISGGPIKMKTSGATSPVAINLDGKSSLEIASPIELLHDGTSTNLEINTADATAMLTLSGKVSGPSAGIVKNGAGTLRLAGTSENSYTGGTTLNEGTLQISTNFAPIGLGTLTLNGGAIEAYNINRTLDNVYVINDDFAVAGTKKLSLTGAGTLAADATITVANAAGTLELGTGKLTGAGKLTKAGTGTLILSGASNDYAGGTKITAGTLQIAADANLGATSGAVELAGGTLKTTAAVTTSRAMSVTAASTLDAGANFTYSGTLTGTAGLTKSGTGTLIVTSNNAGYTGPLTVSDGKVQLGTGGSTNGSLGGDIALSTATTAAEFNYSGAKTYAGKITGAGAVTVTKGDVTLSGNNSYNGATTVTAGSLALTGTNTGTGATAVNGTSKLNILGSTASATTTIASGATLGGAGNGTTTGTLGGNLNMSAGGILTPGDLGTTNSIGTLNVTGNVTLADTTSLLWNFGTAGVEGGATNDLVKVGGTLALGGANLTIANYAALSTGVYTLFHTNTLASGTLDLDAALTAAGWELQITNSQVNVIKRGASDGGYYWDGAGNQNTAGIQGGNGTWDTTAGNIAWTNQTGDTINNSIWTADKYAVIGAETGTAGGTITVATVSASGIEIMKNYTLNSGTLTLTSADATKPEIKVTGATTVATVNSTLSGAKGLNKTGDGTLVLGGTANNYAGGTKVTAGTLQIAADTNLGAAAGAVELAGGTLKTTAAVTTSRAMSVTAASTLEAGDTLTYSGALSGTATLTKSGNGTLIVTADNAGYTGSLTVSTGKVQLGTGTGTAGSVGGNIALSTATTAAEFNYTGAKSYAGIISGAGNVTVTKGDVTLSNAQTYNGLTTVSNGASLTLNAANSGTGNRTVANNGKLYVNGSVGTGTTTIGSGAILGGGTAATPGVINGNVTINGGTLAPGSATAGSAGQLTFTGNLTFSGGQMQWDLGATGAGGATNDLATVQGQLDLGGATLKVADITTLGTGVYTIFNTPNNKALNDFLLDTALAAAGFVKEITGTQVNIVKQGASDGFYYWDGATANQTVAGVQGGNGTWDMTATNKAWTNQTGDIVNNGAWTADKFAIIGEETGTAGGTITVGTVSATGMQVKKNYIFNSGTLTLTGTAPEINVLPGATATVNTTLAGTAGMKKSGTGLLIIGGDNSYTGGTNVSAGELQLTAAGAIKGSTTIANNATLSGTGKAASGGAGAVTVSGGGIVSPGVGGVGTLNAASMVLSNTSVLNFDLITPANGDKIVSAGALTLDGVLNIAPGGLTTSGSYRLFDYAGGIGAFTNQNLEIGSTLPTGVNVLDLQIDTATANQVNLVYTKVDDTTNPEARLAYWDGGSADKAPDNVVNGGLGTWNATTKNWTNANGSLNAPWADKATAVFQTQGGDVTLSGTLTAGGLRFDVDNYKLTGANLALNGTAAKINVVTAGHKATLDTQLTGTGFEKIGAGTLVLTKDNTMAATITAGTLQLGDGTGTTGSVSGNIANSGTAVFNYTGAKTYAGIISGTGAVTVTKGDVTLSGNNSYNGATTVTAGSLTLSGANTGTGVTNVNGTSKLIVTGSTASATTTIASGATLAGTGNGTTTGLITGNVDMTAGGTLQPGNNGVGTLKIAGNLTLGTSTILDWQLGTAGVVGGATNDLVNVTGVLDLGGATLNVANAASLGGGVYTIFGTSTLANGTMNLSTALTTAGFYVTKSTTGVVITKSDTSSNYFYWDGTAGVGTAGIQGGNGTWDMTTTNRVWTDIDGNVANNNAWLADKYAVIGMETGTAGGTITVGTVSADGVQFKKDYTLSGGTLTLTGSSEILVDAGKTATVNTKLAGSAGLNKAGTGTLVLGGANIYSGATNVNFGTLQMANGSSVTGAVNLAANTTLTGDNGTIGGTLTAANDSTISPGIAGTAGGVGTLFANSVALSSGTKLVYDLLSTTNNDKLAVTSGLTLAGTLDITTPTLADGTYTLMTYGSLNDQHLQLGNMPAGVNPLDVKIVTGSGKVDLVVAKINDATEPEKRQVYWDGGTADKSANGAIEGGAGTWNATLKNWTNDNGSVNAAWADKATAHFQGTGGDVTLSGANTASGLLFEVGGYKLTGASLALNGTAAEVKVVTGKAIIDTQLTGSGAGLKKTGTGTLELTKANTYAGTTAIDAGTLYLNNGSLSGATTIASAGTLSGNGAITGNVTSTGGTITVGTAGASGAVGVIAVTGNLSLDSASKVNIKLGEAGTAGGTKNDLITVSDKLTLDGTLNVELSSGGVFGPGEYVVMTYGTLDNQTIELGTLPLGATSATVRVDVAEAGKVKLVNTAGLTLNYWDGAATNTTGVEGGAGTWSATGTNWTTGTGSPNGTWTDADFAMFTKAGGDVTISGTAKASGMQFTVDGYKLTGGALQLTGNAGAVDTISVGDGTAGDLSKKAIIDTVISGNADLRKTGMGTLELTKANTYTGTTNIAEGTLLLTGTGSVKSAEVKAAAALAGTGTVTGALLVADEGIVAPGGVGAAGVLTAGSLSLNGLSQLAYDLAAPGNGEFIKVNGGLTLDGVLNIAPGGLAASGTYRLFEYGTLTADRGLEIGSTLPTGVNALDLKIDKTTAGQINLVFTKIDETTNPEARVVYWDGMQTSANNLVDGGNGEWNTTATNWTNDNGSINAIWPTNATAIFRGNVGTVNVAGAVSAGGLKFETDNYKITGSALALYGTQAEINTGANKATIDVALSGNGFNKTGTGTLVLTQDATLATATTVTAGKLQLGDGTGTTGSVSGDIVNKGAVEFNYNGAKTYAGNLSDAGTVTLTAGTLTLSGANTGTGAMAVNGTSKLIVSGTGSTKNATTTIASGATLAGTGTVGAASSNTNVSGKIDIGNAGAGVLNIGGNLALAGASHLVYELGKENAAGSNDPLNDLLKVAGNLTIASGTLIDITNATLAAGEYRLIDFTGSLTGTGNLVIGTVADTSVQSSWLKIVYGANTVSIKNSMGLDVNYWDGANTTPGSVAGGRGGAGTWSATGANWTNNAGTNNDVLESDLTAVFGATGDAVAVSGTVQAAGLEFKANGYTLSGGKISLTTPTSDIKVVNAADKATINSEITGGVAVSKTGAGTLVLGGANTYTGTTSVSAGTLALASTGSIGGNVAVAANATLAGTGSIGGAVTTAADAILSPGMAAGDIGTLAVKSLVMDSGTKLAYDFGTANASDRIDVGTGGLTLDGILNIASPTLESGTYTLMNYGGTLTDNHLDVGAHPSDVNLLDLQITTTGGAVKLIYAKVDDSVNPEARMAYWDGGIADKNADGKVNGGDGTWAAATKNWTNIDGSVEAPWADKATAIFGGENAGTVTLEAGLTASALRFEKDGYTLTGESLALNGVGSGIVSEVKVATGKATIDVVLSGTGVGLNKTGNGDLELTKANVYTGATTVTAGKLFVNGSIASDTTVKGGATLGGTGTITGNVTVEALGHLAPGNSPGVLSIDGNLTLAATSVIDFEIGEIVSPVGSASTANDLINVTGDIDLGGATLNVIASNLQVGVYRVINYTGTITGTLDIVDPTNIFEIQTDKANVVNLLAYAPGAKGNAFNYWDASCTGTKGGAGEWNGNPTDIQWTNGTGTQNAKWEDCGMAIFDGACGLVKVDCTENNVQACGLQFLTDGYEIAAKTTTDVLTLVAGTDGKATIAVGVMNNDANDAGLTATISAKLTGNTTLVKAGAGKLVLGRNNDYTGGTEIKAGTLSIRAGTSLGDGTITFDGGTLETVSYNPPCFLTQQIVVTENGGAIQVPDTGLAFTGVSGSITGTGTLEKKGAGILMLTDDNTGFTGTMLISEGLLQLGSGAAAGAVNGGLLNGDIINNAQLLFTHFMDKTYGGVISGTGEVIKQNTGVLTLSGDSSYTGGTTINSRTTDSSTLKLTHENAAGAAESAITIADAARLNKLELAFNDGTLDNAIIGEGQVDVTGSNVRVDGDNTGFTAGGLWNVTGTMLAHTEQNLGAAEIALNGTGSQLTLDPTTGGFTLANVLTGDGTLATNFGDATQAMKFDASAGTAFTGTLALGNATMNIAGLTGDDTNGAVTNVQAIANTTSVRLDNGGTLVVNGITNQTGTLDYNADNTVDIANAGDSVFSTLHLNGGTLRFEDAQIPGRTKSDGFLTVDEIILNTGAVQVDMNTQTPMVDKPLPVGSLTLLDQQTLDETTFNVVQIASGNVTGDVSNIQLQNLDGVAAAPLSTGTQIEQNGTVVATADYGMALATTRTAGAPANDGLYVGYRLVQLNILDDQTLVIDNANSTNKILDAKVVSGVPGSDDARNGKLAILDNDNDPAGFVLNNSGNQIGEVELVEGILDIVGETAHGTIGNLVIDSGARLNLDTNPDDNTALGGLHLTDGSLLDLNGKTVTVSEPGNPFDDNFANKGVLQIDRDADLTFGDGALVSEGDAIISKDYKIGDPNTPAGEEPNITVEGTTLLDPNKPGETLTWDIVDPTKGKIDLHNLVVGNGDETNGDAQILVHDDSAPLPVDGSLTVNKDGKVIGDDGQNPGDDGISIRLPDTATGPTDVNGGEITAGQGADNPNGPGGNGGEIALPGPVTVTDGGTIAGGNGGQGSTDGGNGGSVTINPGTDDQGNPTGGATVGDGTGDPTNPSTITAGQGGDGETGNGGNGGDVTIGGEGDTTVNPDGAINAGDGGNGGTTDGTGDGGQGGNIDITGPGTTTVDGGGTEGGPGGQINAGDGGDAGTDDGQGGNGGNIDIGGPVVVDNEGEINGGDAGDSTGDGNDGANGGDVNIDGPATVDHGGEIHGGDASDGTDGTQDGGNGGQGGDVTIGGPGTTTVDNGGEIGTGTGGTGGNGETGTGGDGGNGGDIGIDGPVTVDNGGTITTGGGGDAGDGKTDGGNGGNGGGIDTTGPVVVDNGGTITTGDGGNGGNGETGAGGDGGAGGDIDNTGDTTVGPGGEITTGDGGDGGNGKTDGGDGGQGGDNNTGGDTKVDGGEITTGDGGNGGNGETGNGGNGGDGGDNNIGGGTEVTGGGDITSGDGGNGGDGKKDGGTGGNGGEVNIGGDTEVDDGTINGGNGGDGGNGEEGNGGDGGDGGDVNVDGGTKVGPDGEINGGDGGNGGDGKKDGGNGGDGGDVVIDGPTTIDDGGSINGGDGGNGGKGEEGQGGKGGDGGDVVIEDEVKAGDGTSINPGKGGKDGEGTGTGRDGAVVIDETGVIYIQDPGPDGKSSLPPQPGQVTVILAGDKNNPDNKDYTGGTLLNDGKIVFAIDAETPNYDGRTPDTQTTAIVAGDYYGGKGLKDDNGQWLRDANGVIQLDESSKGSIVLNAWKLAGNDDSVVDQLRINGNAYGHTDVTILPGPNVGLGGWTTGEGILVISVGGTSAADAFKMTNELYAGFYEYDLFHGSADNNWYLRSYGLSPTGGVILNGAAANSLAWFSGNDNLLKRMGELRLQGAAEGNGISSKEQCGGAYTGEPVNNGDYTFWARAHGSQTNIDIDDYIPGSRAYTYGGDVGADIAWTTDEGMLYTGAFAGYIGNTVNLRGNNSNAKSKLNGVQGGLYATYMHQNGFYADIVGKAMYGETEIDSGLDEGDYDSYGLGVSAELGWQLTSAQGWFVEPSMMAAYMHAFNDTYSTDGGIRVRMQDSDIGQFTGMVRAGKNLLVSGTMIQPYVKAGYMWQTTSGGHVSTVDQRYRPTLDGGNVLVGAGVNWQVTPATQIHLDYEASFGDKADKPWGINLGVTTRF